PPIALVPLCACTRLASTTIASQTPAVDTRQRVTTIPLPARASDRRAHSRQLECSWGISRSIGEEKKAEGLLNDRPEVLHLPVVGAIHLQQHAAMRLERRQHASAKNILRHLIAREPEAVNGSLHARGSRRQIAISRSNRPASRT